MPSMVLYGSIDIYIYIYSSTRHLRNQHLAATQLLKMERRLLPRRRKALYIYIYKALERNVRLFEAAQGIIYTYASKGFPPCVFL